jgi:sulfotransferase
MKSFEKFIALSGLPRSGSTLLSSILSQNPNIHSEGLSSVCQLMWDMQNSLELVSVKNSIIEFNKINLKNDLMGAIPSIYYKDIKESIVFDKSRSWTLPSNVDMFKKYIDLDAKMIVLERPILDIVKSFVNLRIENNYKGNPEEGLIDENNEYIRRPLSGIKWAKQNNNGEFLFIQYDDFISDPQKTLDDIYTFCNIKPYNHNFNNITPKYHQNDDVYFLKNLHKIRSTISKRNVNVKLSQNIINKCVELENS